MRVFGSDVLDESWQCFEMIGFDAYLNSLPMSSEDVDPYNRLPELGVRTLYNIIVNVFFVSQRVEGFEDKFEEGLKVLGIGRGNEYV